MLKLASNIKAQAKPTVVRQRSERVPLPPVTFPGANGRIYLSESMLVQLGWENAVRLGCTTLAVPGFMAPASVKFSTDQGDAVSFIFVGRTSPADEVEARLNATVSAEEAAGAEKLNRAGKTFAARLNAAILEELTPEERKISHIGAKVSRNEDRVMFNSPKCGLADSTSAFLTAQGIKYTTLLPFKGLAEVETADGETTIMLVRNEDKAVKGATYFALGADGNPVEVKFESLVAGSYAAFNNENVDVKAMQKELYGAVNETEEGEEEGFDTQDGE
jgi:hypothetical protein